MVQAFLNVDAEVMLGFCRVAVDGRLKQNRMLTGGLVSAIGENLHLIPEIFVVLGPLMTQSERFVGVCRSGAEGNRRRFLNLFYEAHYFSLNSSRSLLGATAGPSFTEPSFI